MLTEAATATLESYRAERAQRCRRHLERANHRRLQRASLRRRLSELGSRDARNLAAELIVDPPDWLEGMELGDLLIRIPYITPDRARLALERRGINVTRTVGGLRGLTHRQAVQIAAALRAPGGFQ